MTQNQLKAFRSFVLQAVCFREKESKTWLGLKILNPWRHKYFTTNYPLIFTPKTVVASQGQLHWKLKKSRSPAPNLTFFRVDCWTPPPLQMGLRQSHLCVLLFMSWAGTSDKEQREHSPEPDACVWVCAVNGHEQLHWCMWLWILLSNTPEPLNTMFCLLMAPG